LNLRPSGEVVDLHIPSDTLALLDDIVHEGTALTIPADNPIHDVSEDLLGRGPAAEAFARQVLYLDASEGAVVGVLGRWGSGKTSFVNMAREKLVTEDVVVLDFNPWMFSGTQQLVEAFFVEVGAQLRLRKSLADIGDQLSDYGEAFAGLGWLPMVGPWIERGRGAAKVLGKFLSRRREGSTGRRQELVEALRGLQRPIAVVIDDIDRLTTPEIRDIFKLVRLTASFPNIVYVVAFDRERVESALTEEGVPGRDYLEKILQVAVDLPVIPERVLRQQLFEALDAAIGQAENSAPLDPETWPDVFIEVIAPLVKNMRDVRRYQLAVRGTLDDVGDRVALVDLLAMEAVRIFLPDVFRELQHHTDALCTPSESLGMTGRDHTHLKEGVERVIEAGGKEGDVVRALIERLFPFAKRHLGGSHYGGDWQRRFLRERRVSHDAILRLYLERVAGEELTNYYDAERAWERMSDQEGFKQALVAIDPERREDVIHSLEAYEDDFQVDHVVPAVVVLANIENDLPNRPRGMFDFDPKMTVHRVTYRLLRSLSSPDQIEHAVVAILPQIETLSAKREIISQVGYQEGAGHKLVSEEAAAQFEAEWRAEVHGASPDDLAREHDLARVIYWSRQGMSREEGEAPDIPADPKVTMAALKSALTETKSQSADSRAVRRNPVLAWDTLVDIYRGEEVLLTRIRELQISEEEIPEELGALIQRYVDGWRPPAFGHRDEDET
jgi:hypothetical protein